MNMNNIDKNNSNSVIKLLTAVVLMAFLILAGLGLIKANAAQLSISISSTDGYPCDKIYDDSYFSTDYYDPGTEITVSADENMDSLYIQWDTIPGEWTLRVNGNDYKYGKEGYLHEYVKLPEAASSATIVVGDTRLTIADIYAFSTGTLPAFVQTWDASYEEADVLLISTHADDEVLFFGGIIPNYIDRGARVQVAYFTNLFLTEPVRNHEILNGLWTMGVTHYPQLGEFYDSYSESYEEAAGQYDYDAGLEYIVRTIRRFHPQVVIGQDPLNGEYGHGGHMFCARLIEDALEITSDESKYADSAKKYGTWDVPKTYFHLYPDNQIVMDVRTPLQHFGGQTALEVARAAYLEHQSQQWCWFYVTDDGYDAYGNYDDKGYTTRCTVYGLYRTTVGADFTGNDIFDNITPYDAQAKPVTAETVESTDVVEGNQGDVQAADSGDNTPANSVVDSNGTSSTAGGKNTGALTVLIVIAIILFIAIIGIYVVASSKAKLKEKEKAIKKAEIRKRKQNQSRQGNPAVRKPADIQQTMRTANRSQGMRSQRMRSANGTSRTSNGSYTNENLRTRQSYTNRGKN